MTHRVVQVLEIGPVLLPLGLFLVLPQRIDKVLIPGLVALLRGECKEVCNRLEGSRTIWVWVWQDGHARKVALLTVCSVLLAVLQLQPHRPASIITACAGVAVLDVQEQTDGANASLFVLDAVWEFVEGLPQVLVHPRIQPGLWSFVLYCCCSRN